MNKKPYIAPQLIVHGDVEKITLAGNQPNSDRPNGTVNDTDAFPLLS